MHLFNSCNYKEYRHSDRYCWLTRCNYGATIHSAVSSYALHFKNYPFCRHTGNPPTFCFNPAKIRNWRGSSIMIENHLCQRPRAHLSFGRGNCWCSPLDWKLIVIFEQEIFYPEPCLQFCLQYQLLGWSCQFWQQCLDINRYLWNIFFFSDVCLKQRPHIKNSTMWLTEITITSFKNG